MSKRFAGLVVAGALLVSPAMGYAATAAGSAAHGGAKWTLSLTKDYTPSAWTSEVGWSNRAVAKLGFGLKNALLGWTELFTEPKEAIDKKENFFVGLGKGIKNGVEQELGGAVHVLTFPLTELDAPLPEGGTSIL